MRITEILLEYRRDVTAKNFGVKLILAIARDVGHLPPLPTDLEYLRQSAQDFTRGVRDAVYNLVIVPSILADEAKSLMGKSDYGLTDFINYDIKIEQKGGIVKASKW